MRARESRPRRTKAVTMMLEEGEFERVERAAASHDLGPFCRRIVMAQIAHQLDRAERLILAEVCATRREVEALLASISDLEDSDIDRARSEADQSRRALVEQRIEELRASGGENRNA